MFTYELDNQTELRQLREQHTDELFALTDKNRAHLRRWLPWLDRIESKANTENFIKSSLEQFRMDNGLETGIWFRNSLVGVIGYHWIDWENRITSIGYWLDESHQGQGLITRACQTMVDHAFKELKLNRIEIRCATKNQKSRAIPERLGFREEGIIKEAEWLYDHFVDHVLYGLVAHEWENMRRT
ncbi:GNAT family N-acetyltransferase [candidate division KSB1 bacterium]|nr:GNAT family N-acetyltransferase [candidate division KSB1 bacterium]NIR70594.1 GNAT family N-acetyltransferase [candidate division KSB1 bacterium]NIS24539.1 GNAT family N-acetyltransferase [candidate division KSB1 bacterium]NIT71457.1 GNAT family N-acetyltransferase [candidate division KSB1 bacterium]NIU25148.1 GNAT family N-acetyltransferase [candidate division KSB1 bacterium]